MAVCFETGFHVERLLKSNRASQHKRIMIRFILLLAMLLSSLASPVQGAQQLVLGVLAYRPKPVMEQAWRPLAESLVAALPDTALTLRILDSTEFTQALRKDELDVVFTNPTHFIALRSENVLSGVLATVVTMHQGKPKSTLGGVIIVRSERTELNALSDLRNKRARASRAKKKETSCVE